MSAPRTATKPLRLGGRGEEPRPPPKDEGEAPPRIEARRYTIHGVACRRWVAVGAPARVSGNIDRKRFRSSALWCKMEALGKRVAMVAQGAPLLAETLDKLGVGEWSEWPWWPRVRPCLRRHWTS